MGKAKAINTIEFEAIIPPLKSAINVDGSGGAQAKLEISEQYIEAVKQLMDCRGRVLRVTVEVD